MIPLTAIWRRLLTLFERNGLVPRSGPPLVAFFLLVGGTLAALFLPPRDATAQALHNPFGERGVSTGLELAASPAGALPLWIYANEHHLLGSGDGPAAALRATLADTPLEAGLVSLAYGADLAARSGRSLYFHQLYGAARLGALQLRLGRIEQQTPVPDPRLSSGAFALSRNARPMPAVSLSVPSFTPLPLTRGWVEGKGYLGHAWFEAERFVERPYLHLKYGYLRLGSPAPVQLYGGLVHSVMWGGSDHPELPDVPRSLGDFKKIFLGRGGGEGAPALDRHAPLGNHLGYWDAGLSTRWRGLELTLYRQFFFDDVFSFRLKTPEDGVLGLSLRRADGKGPVTGLLWEYLHSRTQSDRDNPRTLGQVSNYYNHYFYRDGYTYDGQALGAPLFFLQREDFDPAVHMSASTNNLLVGHHIGVEGELSREVTYRVLATYTHNYGNHADRLAAEENGDPYRFAGGLRQLHLFMEAAASPRPHLSVRAGVGLDAGELRPQTLGLRLGLRWEMPLGQERP